MAAVGKDVRRSLHWVMKVGNLRRSIDFMTQVFGMRVLRHEEFDSGCEATCNGPYGGRWSKTMVGYGPEHKNFALELTANYGVHEYDKQDDLRQIVVRSDIAGPRFAPFRRSRQVKKALEQGWTVLAVDGSKISGKSAAAHPCRPPLDCTSGRGGDGCDPSGEPQPPKTGSDSDRGQKSDEDTLGKVAASAASIPDAGTEQGLASIPDHVLLSADSIIGPDKIKYKLADTSGATAAASDCADGKENDKTKGGQVLDIDPFLAVCLSVKDLAKSLRYWKDLLGMQKVDIAAVPGAEGGHRGASTGRASAQAAARSAGAAAARAALTTAGMEPRSGAGSAEGTFRSACLAYLDGSTGSRDGDGAPGPGRSQLGVPALQLVETGEEVQHGTAFGRIAFATREGPTKIWEAVKGAEAETGGRVINDPITLTTPGKADVVVTILADPDGYEICFVNEDGFYDLCSLKPGDDYIDWEERASLGGDGYKPPSLEGEGAPLPPTAGKARLLRPQEESEASKSTAESDAPTLSEAVAAEGRCVIMWAASWCKYCKRALPAYTKGSEMIAEEHKGDSSSDGSPASGADGSALAPIRFYLADADRMQQEKQASSVKQIPAFIFYDAGKEVGRYSGSDPEDVAVRLAAFARGGEPDLVDSESSS